MNNSLINISAADKRADLATESFEPEYQDDAPRIVNPFDPALIRVDHKSTTLGQLLARIEHGEIDMQPDFQRRPGIWTDGAQSRLIESVLIRIPIPAFYFDGANENRWLVVDGLQRLTALHRFKSGELKLCGLEFLSSMAGAGYNSLTREHQRRIDECQVVAFIIAPGTPVEVKFNIFKRINTGGMPLSPQEIRHALNQGAATEFLAKLASSTAFQLSTLGKFKSNRMDDRECALRFVAFALNDPQLYKDDDFDAFLSASMRQLNELPAKALEDLGKRFDRALNASTSIFGRAAFRKMGHRSNPLNKALFESWCVSIDSLSDQEIERLIILRVEVKQRFRELSEKPGFNDAISQSTGHPAKIRTRFASIKNLINDILNAYTY